MRLLSRDVFALSLALAILMICSTQALATPTIIVGYHPVPLAASTTIDIFVTGVGPGADAIGAIDLNIGIDSESVVAPPGEPKINNIDVVTGTIFAGNSFYSAPGSVLYTSDQLWEIDNITNSGVITTDGKLFTIDLNTLGMSFNLHSLKVFGTIFAPSNFANEVGAFDFVGQDGYFGGPEPSTLVLASAGGIACLATAFRRMRLRKSSAA